MGIELRLSNADSLFDSFINPFFIEDETTDDEIVLPEPSIVTTQNYSAAKCDFQTEKTAIPYPYIHLEGYLNVHRDKYNGKFSIGFKLPANLKPQQNIDFFVKRYSQMRQQLKKTANEIVGPALRYYNEDGVPSIIVQPNFNCLELDINYG